MPTITKLLIVVLALAALARGQHQQQIQSLRPEGAQSVISGIEQNDNGFRHKTPALNRAVVRQSYVNIDGLHDHKVALFGSAPGQVTNTTVQVNLPPPPTAEPVTRTTKAAPAHGDPWPWIGGIVAVMAVMLLVLVRATGRTPVTKNADRFVITSRT